MGIRYVGWFGVPAAAAAAAVLCLMGGTSAVECWAEVAAAVECWAEVAAAVGGWCCASLARPVVSRDKSSR